MSINDIFVGQQVCKQAHTHAKLYRTHTVLHLFRLIIFVHCTALTKPVTDCKKSSSSSFRDILLLNFTSAFRMSLRTVSHTEICQQLDFIVIIVGRLILIVGRIFTGISQTIRYRPSLVAQWSKVLFSDESKFCISFGNQGPRVWRKSGEAQNPCCLKSSVKFPQSLMIWAAMSSAGVGPLCFLKSTVNTAIYQEILKHFMLPSADKLYGDADFIFQQDLAPAHTAKGTKSWFNDHGVTVLDWPANSPDLNPIENLWSIVKRKMRDTRPNNADDLKATVKETWASIPPQQCHKLITSMPRRIEAVIKAKGAPTKY